MSKTTLFSKLAFRIIVVLLTLPVGVELALRLWLWGQSSTPPMDALPNRPLLIVAGDSVTQQGYALEIGRTSKTPYPRESIVNFGRSGARVEYVVNKIKADAKHWQGLPYEIIVMVGHNDCRYLQHLAVMTDSDPDYIPRSLPFLNTLAAVRFYNEWSGLSTLEERHQIVSSPRAQQAPKMSDRSMCLNNLKKGFWALAELTHQYDLNLYLMTYPIPKSALEYALNPDIKSKQTDFVSVNWLVNKEKRKAAQAYDLQMIDAAECMSGKPNWYWHADGLHLKPQGAEAHSKCIIESLSH